MRNAYTVLDARISTNLHIFAQTNFGSDHSALQHFDVDTKMTALANLSVEVAFGRFSVGFWDAFTGQRQARNHTSK